MAEPALLVETPTSSNAPSQEMARERRIRALAIVLAVSFGQFTYSAFYHLLQAEISKDAYQQKYRLVGGLIVETTSLLVLWLVLSGQRRNWKDIGWNLKGMDLPHAIGLFVGVWLLSTEVMLMFQAFYHGYSGGHYLPVRSTQGVLGGGISALSVIFVLVNPFFEELIVRGYTMTEVIGLGGSSTLAVIVSVLVQLSYHVYQGFVRCIALVVVFTLFSIYFVKTRRIAAVILAHLCMDAFALFAVRH